MIKEFQRQPEGRTATSDESINRFLNRNSIDQGGWKDIFKMLKDKNC